MSYSSLQRFEPGIGRIVNENVFAEKFARQTARACYAAIAAFKLPSHAALLDGGKMEDVLKAAIHCSVRLGDGGKMEDVLKAAIHCSVRFGNIM
jgi:hypothetical protein